MKLIKRFLLIFVFININSIAQETGAIKDLVSKYKNFEFKEVVSLSDSLLGDKDSLDDQMLSEVLEYRSASLFALGDENGTRKSFIDLLKIDQNYELSESEYSPKLISLFRDVKREYLSILKDENIDQSPISENSQLETASINYGNYKSEIAKLLFVPGWEIFQMEENTKGIVLTSLGLASLGSMVYFIIDAKSKENDYLSETNSILIQSKYDKFNSSYQIRNALIITYAAVWLYAQIDMLLFDVPSERAKISFVPGSNIIGKDNSTIFSVRISL